MECLRTTNLQYWFMILMVKVHPMECGLHECILFPFLYNRSIHCFLYIYIQLYWTNLFKKEKEHDCSHVNYNNLDFCLPFKIIFTSIVILKPTKNLSGCCRYGHSLMFLSIFLKSIQYRCMFYKNKTLSSVSSCFFVCLFLAFDVAF